MGTGTSGRSAYRPWFKERPRLMLAVSAGLFVGVAALHVVLTTDATVGATVLLILPIGLVSLAYGRVAGVLAGLAGVASAGVWVRLDDTATSPIGLLSLAGSLLLVGYILGDASERLDRAEEDRLAAEVEAVRHAQAAEVNDHLVQGIAAAKWLLEGGATDRSLEVLQATIGDGQRMVSELLHDVDRRAGVRGDGREARHGPPGFPHAAARRRV